MTTYLIINNLFKLSIGALTSKPYSFKSRPWELFQVGTINILDSWNSTLYVDFKNMEIFRILPQKILNNEWITDFVRFSYDSLYLQRIKSVYYNDNSEYQNLEIDLDLGYYILNNLNKERETINSLGPNLDLFTFFYLKKNKSKKMSNIYTDYYLQNNLSNNRLNYLINLNFKNISSIFILGINLRQEFPLLNIMLKKQKKTIYLLGIPSYNLSYNFIYLGLNFLIILKILLGKNKYSFILLKKYLFFSSNNSFLSKIVNLKNLLINETKLKIYFLFNNNSIIHSLESVIIRNKSKFLNKNKKYLFLLINQAKLKSNKTKNSFIIYQGSHGISINYNLLVPSCTHFEKKLYYVNILGEIKKTNLIYNSFDCKSNFIIILKIFENLNSFISLSILKKLKYYTKKMKLTLNINQQNFFKVKKILYMNNIYKNFFNIYSNLWLKSSKIMGISSQIYLKKKMNYYNKNV